MRSGHFFMAWCTTIPVEMPRLRAAYEQVTITPFRSSLLPATAVAFPLYKSGSSASCTEQ